MTTESIKDKPRHKHHGTVFQDEQALLRTLINLHTPHKKIDLDPMFFKGNFYREIEEPKMIFDIDPQVPRCKRADATTLPLTNKSISSMILDPPFLFNIHGNTQHYYSSRTHGIYKDFNELAQTYKQLLDEAYRVLKKKGVLFFKCQDYTDSKTTLTHCHVFNWATERGFYAKDLAILHLPRNKIYNSKTQQRHLRKHHSYFFVFCKR